MHAVALRGEAALSRPSSRGTRATPPLPLPDEDVAPGRQGFAPPLTTSATATQQQGVREARNGLLLPPSARSELEMRQHDGGAAECSGVDPAASVELRVAKLQVKQILKQMQQQGSKEEPHLVAPGTSQTLTARAPLQQLTNRWCACAAVLLLNSRSAGTEHSDLSGFLGATLT